MKQYIDDIISGLKSGGHSDVIPEVPQAPTDGKTLYLDPAHAEVVPEDLSNQELSCDPAQKVKQLDYQAQLSEQKQTIG
jgi:hypothetical protein